jgi:pyruvate dehydrogenase E1 component beta subunit
VTGVPGLKVVVPSSAYEAKGLMLTAIRDDDPVVFFEHKALYPRKGPVPEGDYTIPFGEANLVREGEHVTVVAIGRMVSFAEKALDALAADGITADLIDPRTLSPLDDETIYESLENTGRLVIVDESPPRCSVAADIAGLVASNAFHALKAPIAQVTPPHTPVPFARELERAYVPGPQAIEAAIRRLIKE